MIKADERRKNSVSENAERIKVAVLDSRIDWGNDINLVYQVSLVPGEEEMTQVFMDGTGHGSSVASLIAADDNGDGITGISHNADIYSYRVLDDENKAPVSRVVEAVYMAIEQKVHIINMSFGLDGYSEALKEAVHAAEEAGILVIAAAGNTGSGGVQYPAAYDEVMAVGAVNKEGLVEDYSARGSQIEIVAPGELVRTTGFIGSEEVTSGTSLAAPQITAVAALIWQKDTKVSAGFVRGLLNESANLYGKTDEYGNGLVDAEYARKHYEEYKRKYEENGEKTKLLIPENQSEIMTFEDTGCVEGSWSKDDHEKLIDSGKYCVRAGARFPDLNGVKEFTYGGNSYKFDMGSKTSSGDNRKFAGMTKSPWWHGYYDNNNYIQAAIYATRIADAINAYGNYNLANETVGYSVYSRAAEMRNSIKLLYDNSEIGWKYVLKYMKGRNSGNSGAQNQKNTDGFKRAIVWGMAIHTATDAYAHSAEDRYGRIKHTGDYYDADRTGYIGYRYQDASSVAEQMMKKYKSKGELTARDLMMPGNYTAGYKMINYENYIQAVDAGITGYTYWFSTK